MQTDPNIYLASLNTANLFLMSGLLDNPNPSAPSPALGGSTGGPLGGNSFSLSEALKMPNGGTKTSPLGSDFAGALSNFGSGLGPRVMTPNKPDLNQNLGESKCLKSTAVQITLS